MKAVDYLKEKARMCEENTCYDCRLTFGDWDRKSPCLDTERDKSEQAVTIVEKWAKENPPKTYLSVLFEKFPNVKKHRNGIPVICPHDLFGESRWVDCCLDYEICKKCWNREYKEEI